MLEVVLALNTFLGAWAASADVGDQRTLAFALPGTTPSLSGSNIRQETIAVPYPVARIDDQGGKVRLTRVFWNLPTIHGLGCGGHGQAGGD